MNKGLDKYVILKLFFQICKICKIFQNILNIFYW